MESFIAYFDYLGFKDFILNNDMKYQSRIMRNIFRDIELSLGQGKLKDTAYGAIADLSLSKLNCINFSDTVVFWTNDISENSLRELLLVTYAFNWRNNDFSFPVRGAVVFGDIFHTDFKETSASGGKYNVNSVFGKGIINAYLKAESQHWAGTVVDKSLIEELEKRKMDINSLLSPLTKKYKVPYRDGIVRDEEYVFRLVEGNLNDKAFKNVKKGIEENFSAHNKDVSDPRVKEKLENTIKFLESFLPEDK